ncbi:MAG: hypothetical protein II843_02050 [Alphaproteobacteria bacterium]|nr:hypothetical protein [Alphaproteobacteria bacterium]MBQ6012255.1 hypothetical protein [Alphaproteobacteria bacterium]
MKTKIIYISGNEIFDMRDIRGAFEEVRAALNLDKNTVLFGVPVDAEDAGFATKTADKVENIPEQTAAEIEPKPVAEVVETRTEIVEKPDEEEIKIESVVADQPVKKRGRPRKESQIENVVEPVEEVIDEPTENSTEEQPEEQIVPILSVLGSQEDVVDKESTENTEIIPDIPEDVTEYNEITIETVEADDDAGLEKLLSAMTPLQEDVLEDQPVEEPVAEQDSLDDVSADATLQQLASEFIENQDKIAAETKQTARSKIGKLRNILPFKQSKRKDSGLGDLFGWAGIAANDEDFSVPGFFTSTASKK